MSAEIKSRASRNLSNDRPQAAMIHRHSVLVRVAHWINAVSFLFLLPSGIAILIAHPELYWGETGYFGAPAALRFPIEPNFDHTWWGRGMHFVFAWVLVLNGLVYLIVGLLNGHFYRKMLPTGQQMRLGYRLRDIRQHIRLPTSKGEASAQYNVLQKISYLTVVFVLFPVVLLTGLTMSPAVTAAIPELFGMFGGRQSARTIHFIIANLLVLFLLIHVFRVFAAGVVNHVQSMITGKFVIEPDESNR